ncbi:MAG: hypothetical protein ACW98F_20670, partial [Candidatus Hodarchaeales archaeon]
MTEDSVNPNKDSLKIRTILNLKFLFRLISYSLFGGIYFFGSSLLAGNQSPWLNLFQGWVFSLSILILSIGIKLIIYKFQFWKSVILIFGCTILALWALYFYTTSTLLAWIVVILSYSLFLQIGYLASGSKRKYPRIAFNILFALGIGASTIALVQIDATFADEEFFSAIYAFIIAGYWYVLHTLDKLVIRPLTIQKPELNRSNFLVMFIVLGCLILIGSVLFLRSYQLSFYPNRAPSYVGINSNAPFICGQLQPGLEVFDGQEVYNEFIQSLELNPQKTSPEYGMLALLRDDEIWAEKFRESILEEAHLGLFTEPAHSVKYGQYESTFRIYY